MIDLNYISQNIHEAKMQGKNQYELTTEDDCGFCNAVRKEYEALGYNVKKSTYCEKSEIICLLTISW